MIRETSLAGSRLWLPATFGSQAETLEAETIYGRVRGYLFKGVAIFRNIPYGGITEGDARFLPPAKLQKWTGVLDTTVAGHRCFQGSGNIFTSKDIGAYFSGGRSDAASIASETNSENCLNLNVSTPALTGKRPVMVYIHGGGFSGGSGVLTVFANRHVVEQDVVLVGINHRLNVFGYTYLGGLSEKYVVGNPGQLDLVAALEWVRDNIAQFGGDPGNVMIFGESGGGAKISTLLAMPSAKGLFHKAAIQSGSLIRVANAEDATRSARDLMRKLGLSKVEDLVKVPASDLFKAGPKGLAEVGPVVDSHSLPKQTWDPVAPALAANIPLLIGNDKDESSLFSLQNESLFSLDNTGLRSALLKVNVPQERVDTLIALYQKEYPKENPSDLYFRISTDRGARWNAVKQAERQLAGAKSPVFLYYFQWNTPLVDGKIRSFHTADLPLTMRLVRYSQAELLSKQLSGAWAAFARTGNPSQKGLVWPSYTLSERTTMIFDLPQSKAIKDPHKAERIMLQDIPSGSLL
ncbi:carboxylesterase/lipase family protein [Spirosoma sp. BT702]|uniref:Carboxylic ester hydrolase n=1 Tax=Spirosoma profusum TaxID=2771354 RepID=A0A927AVE4_9BACT|nr:carboxylesterase family protein [Spirosoma profusum]MBD2705132.1 carboxylesterase/lipase family protein [Spirosoma profusum]